MEFLAAGAAILICMIFFWDSFKESKDSPKRGIFSAYPVSKNMVLNFIQEFLATFFFLFLVFMAIALIDYSATGALVLGLVGFGAVALLALTLNSTGFSMNVMRSFFSSVWFAILPIPNKNGEKVDWAYQLVVNLVGSSLGGVAAVIVTSLIKAQCDCQSTRQPPTSIASGVLLCVIRRGRIRHFRRLHSPPRR